MKSILVAVLFIFHISIFADHNNLLIGEPLKKLQKTQYRPLSLLGNKALMQLKVTSC